MNTFLGMKLLNWIFIILTIIKAYYIAWDFMHLRDERSTSFGDMIISLSVEVPKNLSENQKRLLREFDEESSQKNNPESSGFFSKVKDFWDGLT